MYKDKNGDRRFRIYNYNQKSILYQVGKKKGFSYKWPRVKYRGRFFNKYAIDEVSYRKKKDDSFSKNDDVEEEEGRMSKERKIAIINWFLALKHYQKLSQEDFTKVLYGVGIKINQQQVSNMMVEVRKSGLLTTYQ